MKQRSILLVLALAFVLIVQGQTRRQRLPQQAQPQQQVQAQPQQQVLPQQVTQQVTQHLTSDNSLDAVEIYQKA